MEDPPDLAQAVDEAVHVGGVVVEREARAAAGEVLHAKPREQRLRAVVPGADAHAGGVEDARHVVRVDAAHVEADDAVVVRRDGAKVRPSDDLDQRDIPDVLHEQLRRRAKRLAALECRDARRGADELPDEADETRR